MSEAVPNAVPDVAPTPELPESTVSWRGVAFFRRMLLITFVLGQTAVASYYLLWILPYHGGTLVEIGLIALFALLYAWIAVGFWTAVFGLVLRLGRGDRYSLLNRHSADQLDQTPLARTAVVMPIYHEPVQRTLRGLRAVYRDIERTGNIEHFEFYILSDSRDPNVWLEEQAAWKAMCDELGAKGRLFYRRRTVNLNYKSGNVADFLRRWGRRAKYMIVLDADSLLSGNTLVRMVQLMEREPRTGILQTNPTLINGQSMFARLQQFANRVYSPLFSTGLAAVQMGDAAFWGHNAIIRTDAFMAHCGLRKLPGFGLFKGPIMSHDFVEAAYIGRAGYEVWLEPGLGESYEESPPTISDELTRDERWSKGNLQHLWIMLFGKKIRFAHRMAFLNGIMAYLASPLWFAFLALTTVEAAQMALTPIDYFPEGHQGLFPRWPEWRPLWAVGLALSTFALLFLPKFMAIFDVLVNKTSAKFGGFFKMLISVFLEILVSMLLAPIRMLAHSRYVLGALLNFSLSWAGQNRTEETTWKDAFVSQLPGMIAGLAWSGFAWSLDMMFFLWSLPVAIPLVLAAPTSVLLSRVRVGQALRRHGMLLIPEEIAPSKLLNDTEDERKLLPRLKGLTRFEEAIISPGLNKMHQSFARPHRATLRQEILLRLCKTCLRDGPDALTRSELSHICRDREALSWLHRAVWRAEPESYWGRRLTLVSNQT
ncbi:glucans biosynthesis glucosyltransferase MdoH [Marinobacter sp. BGYM27]|uniref:glucans biosynthesis glucosyltransferase MdoH n=1 Tax=Marinobacter sp. BGYM27 TaxID=2975597 RepID=UPI000C3DCB39|nr:glucans biosynthesis glucosyltransferase MdoH [Marinobacter sp. BGYM27]MBH87315.1 glucans biosynthesis glucosyltransferase MdoH [Alteromonadaceae bacterium]MDG5498988.1 glucans biosynthesis glucosyltransferase MdoH [Marinobacter sp. BGYM27]|tara:strand:- start:60761 stop:62890 length:2130 start_codon:yes stop_codon:yes gene_type:complete